MLLCALRVHLEHKELRVSPGCLPTETMLLFLLPAPVFPFFTFLPFRNGIVAVEVPVTKTNNGHNGITALPESCYSSSYKVRFPSEQGLVTELTHSTGKKGYQMILKPKRLGFCLAYLGFEWQPPCCRENSPSSN